MKRSRGPWYWIPRILAVLLVAFLALFSLDVFQPGLSSGEIALAFFMHNIPVFVMIVVLVFAWKWDLVGVIGFAVAGLLYIGLTISSVIGSNLPWYVAIAWSLQIAGPALIVAALFFVNWRLGRRAVVPSSDPS